METTDDLTMSIIQADTQYGAANYASLPVVLAKGDGCFVWDINGERYFDMLSAYSAVNQGHGNTHIINAAKKQLDTLCLTSRAFHNDKMYLLLKKICEITGKEKVLPMNTGAEGVETAIKAMRKWGYSRKGIANNKAEIIVAAENFHGRTTTIVGFSSDPAAYDGFGPATPGFISVPYNDPEALANAITENTCGVLLEPIQGEAGVNIPADDYLSKVSDICKQNNVLLCCDEIQTGLGRTGKMFCFQHSNINPDLIIMGKALSGGLYPISAVAADAEIMDVFTPGSHGSTYGGNPLASVIGVAALEVLLEEKLADNAAELGDYFVSKLKTLENPKIKEVRGKGLLIAIEFTEAIAKTLCKTMMTQGLIAKDTHNTTVRFAPPLVINKEQIDEAFEIIKTCVESL